MRELALFAGAGGGILGGRFLGWRTVCAVEVDEYARAVILARQDDGNLKPFPVWDDVRTFDGVPWRGLVDVVSGGFPCQDISVAGKGDGLDGERSGLWREMARIIREVQPRFAFVENSPALTGRGLDVVLGDLASLGYDAEWGVLGASDVGAPHRRERIWVVAHLGYSNSERQLQPEGIDRSVGRWAGHTGQGARIMANADLPGCGEQWGAIAASTVYDAVECSGWWRSEPDVGRVAHGVAARVDRLRCLGNGQVPQAAAAAFVALAKRGGWAT